MEIRTLLKTSGEDGEMILHQKRKLFGYLFLEQVEC
jgi:hypothetical protein